MIAIALSRLALLIRLTITMAMVGSLLPAYGHAMQAQATIATIEDRVSEPVWHAHDGHHAHDAADSGHAHPVPTSTGHHQTDALSDCCSDMCTSPALLAEQIELSGARSAVSAWHLDDLRVTAEPIGFHRPPAFRA